MYNVEDFIRIIEDGSIYESETVTDEDKNVFCIIIPIMKEKICLNFVATFLELIFG